METRDIYPIGQQDFNVLRQNEALYIDKTLFIEKTHKVEKSVLFPSPATPLRQESFSFRA